jgi:hypothetical protein
VERERGGEVGEALVGQARRGEELDGRESEWVGGDRGEVEGGEVGKLLQRDGLGGGVGGADLAVDLGQRAGDGRGLAGGRRVGAEGLDEVVQRALEEGVHQRRPRCVRRCRRRLGGGHRLWRKGKRLDPCGSGGNLGTCGRGRDEGKTRAWCGLAVGV